MPEVYKGISVCDRAEGVPDGLLSDTLHWGLSLSLSLSLSLFLLLLLASRRRSCMMSDYLFLARIKKSVLLIAGRGV